MKQIDFLPTRYHEVAAKKKTTVWRCSVVVLFGSAVAMTAVVQYMWRLDVRYQVAQVESMYSVAMSQSQKFSKLQADYANAKHDAELFAYLRHPWPLTQVFSQISQPLPDSIALGEIRLTQEAKEQATPAATPAVAEAPVNDPNAQAKLAPAEADLKRLRAEHDPRVTVVYVSGLSHDASQLHEYVAALANASLFTKAELKSLESDPTATTKQETSKFNLRLVVRPGYGQPNGPTAPPARTETTIEPETPAAETAAVNPAENSATPVTATTVVSANAVVSQPANAP